MDTTTATTALIVDDNYFNRDLCTIALEHVGYEVEDAENGIEALRMLEKDTYDLLVVDLAMPELDGASVISQIRTQPRHEQMTIIVLTANHHMATTEVDLNADYVMYKPIDIEEFSRFALRLTNMKKSS